MNRSVLVIAALFTASTMSLAMYLNFVGNNVIIGGLITFVGFVLVFSAFASQWQSMFGKPKEGFSNFGAFPDSETKLPLEGWYPPKTPFQPSALTYDTMWKDYPSFPAKSTKTNLIRYWDNPSNGTCMWPEQCNAFYGEITPDKFVEPAAPQWGSGIRVNFYDTCLYDQKRPAENEADL